MVTVPAPPLAVAQAAPSISNNEEARMWVGRRAVRICSRAAPNGLLVAQSDRRVEPRGAPRRIDAGGETNAAGNADSQRHRPERNLRGEGQELPDPGGAV